ncbi:MAG: M23 family metallopeptidase [Bacteroidota bacterium]
MKTLNYVIALSAALVITVSSCKKEKELVQPTTANNSNQFDSKATGVSLTLTEGFTVIADPVLFDNYGFCVYAPTNENDGNHSGHENDAVAHVALAYKSNASQLEELVKIKMEQYKEFQLTRTDITFGDGRKGISISGLPGTKPYTVIYTADGDRAYEIGIWSDLPDAIDAKGKAVLDNLKFTTPTQSVESLGLQDAKVAAYATPASAQGALNTKAFNERTEMGEAMSIQKTTFGEMSADDASSRSCGFTAPNSLAWQLQWDGSNTFYSGTYYYLASVPGWSAMSGNYGSWWGTNYHVGLCYTQQSNQYYANDWPAQHWANAYAAFSGYVEWAGWGTDGFYTLGNYVVVRNGSYRNVTAHLSGIASGIYWGAYVDAYYTIIGWAGSTGGPWDPHLHARVSWGESLTYNGQPYGGQSVAPKRLRCYTCDDQDVTATNGAKYYNYFYHGRWMKY